MQTSPCCAHPRGFNPCFGGSVSTTGSIPISARSFSGFNPCFGGSVSTTFLYSRRTTIYHGFNPCFGGSVSTTLGTSFDIFRALSVSILVLVDRSLRPLKNDRNPEKYPFQSLFWWIGLYDYVTADSRREAGGFNPCFGGSVSTTITGCSPIAPARCFNPCFGGSVSTTGYHAGRSRPIRLVSILVLVDRSLRHLAAEEARPVAIRFQSLFWWIGLYDSLISFPPTFPPLCFNPCFGGSVSTTAWTWGRPRSAIRCFNPCFGGSVSTTVREETTISRKARFQSLFWWIGLYDRRTHATPACFPCVSILVLVDRSLRQHRSSHRVLYSVVSILVLVDRSLRPSMDECLSVIERGFNPCFGGSVSTTRLPDSHRSRPHCFNPCFGGSVSTTLCDHALELGAALVSILVLVDRSLRQPWAACEGVIRWCFNPCFGGSVSTTVHQLARLGALGQVSILVLVDRSLRPALAAAARSLEELFQSLFWWIGLYDQGLPLANAPDSQFQSLFWWIGLYDDHPLQALNPATLAFQSLFWWIGLYDAEI